MVTLFCLFTSLTSAQPEYIIIAKVNQVIYSQIVVNQCKNRGTDDMSKQGTFGRSSKLNTLETVHVCTFDYFKSIKNHELTIFSKISVKQIIFSPHKLSYKLQSHELRKKTWVIIKEGVTYVDFLVEIAQLHELLLLNIKFHSVS